MKPYVCVWMALLGAAGSEAQTPIPAYRIDTSAGSTHDGDGGPATLAQLSKMQGIAADRFGNLYISDTDHHRVRKVSASGQITTLAGTGVPGYSGDSGPAAQAKLNLPYGLAVDLAGNLYIADLGNNRIRRVWPDGIITTVAPSVSFATPRNLALDMSGNLYVSEFDGHRVRRIDPAGRITVAAGTGKAGFAGDGGPPESALLANPCGIAIDRGGALLIADSGNNRVRRLFSNGTIGTILGGSSGTALSTPVAVTSDAQGTIYVADSAPVVRSFTVNGKWSDVAGGAAAGFSGDGGPALRAALSSVRDLVSDFSSNLFIADCLRVRKIDPLGTISTVAGNGFVSAIGDGGPATDALLSRPSAVAVDSAGNVIVADTGTQRVRQIANGQIATTVAGLGDPMGVAADASGTTYVADTVNNAVRAIGPDRKVRTITTAVRGPRGLCLSATGILYIADTGNGRIVRMGAGLETVAAGLSGPEACAFDSFGNLYIAETGAHRIRRLSPASEWSTVAGSPDVSFPRGVAADNKGNLYIADTAGNRVRVVTPDGVIRTIAGTGSAGFSGDGDDASRAELNGPAGLAFDVAGNLYIADNLNDRIRRLQPQPLGSDLATPLSVVNSFSGTGGTYAPGELVRIDGTDAPGELRIDGRSLPILSRADSQITAQLPEDLAPGSSARLEIHGAGAANLTVSDAAPGVLPIALNADGTLNTLVRRVATGELITIFVTGQGRLEYGRPVLPVSVTIAGVSACLERAEALPDTPGVVLISVTVPGGFVPSGDVPLVFTAGGVAANPITVWLK